MSHNAIVCQHCGEENHHHGTDCVKCRSSLAQAPGSAVNLRILAALSNAQWTSAGWLAGVVWEKQRGPVGKRAGQWKRMGALLHKLHRAGAVEKLTTRYHQNLWRCSPPAWGWSENKPPTATDAVVLPTRVGMVRSSRASTDSEH
jgi:hypothetical protein